jgi:hypothetical protein
LILWESRGNTLFNDEVALFQRLPGRVPLDEGAQPWRLSITGPQPVALCPVAAGSAGSAPTG